MWSLYITEHKTYTCEKKELKLEKVEKSRKLEKNQKIKKNEKKLKNPKIIKITSNYQGIITDNQIEVKNQEITR